MQTRRARRQTPLSPAAATAAFPSPILLSLGLEISGTESPTSDWETTPTKSFYITRWVSCVKRVTESGSQVFLHSSPSFLRP